MPEFLSGDGLSNRIREVARGRDARCAVAFWGTGAAYEVFGGEFAQRDDVKIICDISMGGTNPLTLRQLGAPENELLKFKESLHAKTYLSEEGLVVGSANASSNGIGRAGSPAGLVEAGSFFPAGSPEWQEAQNWFCSLWDEPGCVEVDQQALERAEDLWRRRAKLPVEFQAEAPAGTVLDYDPDRDGLILLSWYTCNGGQVHDREVAGNGRSFLRISDDDNNGIMGKWICCFQVLDDGTGMEENARPYFFFSSDFEEDYFAEEDSDPHIVYQRVDAPTPPPPFDFDDPYFRRAFQDVINRGDFSQLRDEDHDDPWLLTDHDHINLMRRFWLAVQKAYRDATQA
ncbi:phospholipase D family protein [Roseovarius sp.]|uniref:phospholipase D family protein n=1 Tax=Roseovarius sp. TaxID=1486281 RepID=UPI003BAC9321